MERIIEHSRLALVASALFCTGMPALAAAGASLDDVQKAASEWAQVRSETIRVESDWVWEKTLMQGTHDALQERVRQLEEQRAALEAKTVGARREAAELEEQRRAMAAAVDEATRQLQVLDQRLLRMRPMLPPRLSASLELPFRSLAQKELGMAERMQHTMAILARCAHFNSTINRGEEAIAVGEEGEKLLEVLYFGVGRGYALDRVAGVAYAGGPGEAGWSWVPAPELAKAVDRLLAIGADRIEPEFVSVPLAVGNPAALGSQIKPNTP